MRRRIKLLLLNKKKIKSSVLMWDINVLFQKLCDPLFCGVHKKEKSFLKKLHAWEINKVLYFFLLFTV